MLTIKELNIAGYEKVVEGIDLERGLHCFISVHNTSLGPSLGGTRIHPYTSPQDALQDALRLSKAMTYKSSLAENGLGGGKSVLIGSPHRDKTEKMLEAFAEVVDSLKGKYIAAEDVGSTLQDMATIFKYTPYVAARPSEKSSGDPSRFTAWGVFMGIKAAAMHLWKNPSLKNKTIAVQGLGSVGHKLADFLFWEGANLLVCDINEGITKHYSQECGAKIISTTDFVTTACDILAPCALGGIITAETLPNMQCKAIAGAANNQMHNPELGKELSKRGILYAPDYVINAGGVINAAGEFDSGGYCSNTIRSKVNHIYDVLINIFEKADQQNQPTNLIADEIAEYNIANGIGKRSSPINFTKY